MTGPIYNQIGVHYSKYRRADIRLVQAIVDLLQLPTGGTVAEIGAGTGNYAYALAERGYTVYAVEPADMMLQQRKQHPNILWSKGYAENIPLGDESVDAAIVILAVHHFSNPDHALKEIARVVGDGRVVLFTFDPRQIPRPWLADYFPFLWNDAFQYFPPIEAVAQQLYLATHAAISLHPFPLPYDLQDFFAAAGWRRPELYLDPIVRSCMSGFAIEDQGVVHKGVESLRTDLENGSWDKRYGWIRKYDHYDVGYRFVLSNAM
jgi:ubiquinone/menaquinone biosynthesis C-methylase UbiE